MSKIYKGLEEFESKKEFALELAVRDALVNGTGFVLVDEQGNLTYVDAEEALEKANEVTRNR